MNWKEITEDTKALLAVRLSVFAVTSIATVITLLVTCAEGRLDKIESGFNTSIDKVEKRVFRVEELLMGENLKSETDGSPDQNHEADKEDNNQAP